MADSKNNKQNAGDCDSHWIDDAFALAILALLSLLALVALFGEKSENFYNWMLGIAAIGAGYFWLERNRALKQQAETDRLRLTDERFSDAVKLLSQNDKNGKPAIAARIGGIFVLEKLAKSPGSKYLAQVVKTLVAYIKENIRLTTKPLLAESKISQKARSLGEDVKTAFDVLDTLLDAHKQKTMEQFDLSIDDFNFHRYDFSWLFLSPVKSIDFCNYILVGIDMRGAILWNLDFRGAGLSHANLRESFLRKADLRGTRLDYAELQGADLSDAKLLYADFSGAELDEDTKLPPKLSEEIWHSGQAEFEKQDIKSRAWDAEWDLEPFLNSADSLASILHIYADCHIFHSETGNQKLRAKKLRQAARKLQEDGKIPKGFPQDWLSWLSKVKDDGSHPDDTLPA